MRGCEELKSEKFKSCSAFLAEIILEETLSELYDYPVPRKTLATTTRRALNTKYKLTLPKF